jgi:PEGA domain
MRDGCLTIAAESYDSKWGKSNLANQIWQINESSGVLGPQADGWRNIAIALSKNCTFGGNRPLIASLRLGDPILVAQSAAWWPTLAKNARIGTLQSFLRSEVLGKLEGRMKRILFTVFVLIGVMPIARTSFAAVDSRWQYGRIESVKKSVTTTTKAWVVNTPLDEEHTRYTISVHVQDRIVVGNYEVSSTQLDPPAEWKSGSVVMLQVSGDSLNLRSGNTSLRLKITQRKIAGPMQPITAEEKKALSGGDAEPESMIGFLKPNSEENKAPAPEPAVAPPPPAAATGSVMVRSTPYLSEVFVDGDSMGYTPAKIALGPGKHSFRVEKPGYTAWTKVMTITVGSELTLDATLQRK